MPKRVCTGSSQARCSPPRWYPTAEAPLIAQESWVKGERTAKFTEFNSFEGWVRRITINTAITHYRQLARHHDDVSESCRRREILRRPSRRTSRWGNQTAMSALPKGYRTVIQLYSADGFSHKEIAEMRQVDVNTSKANCPVAVHRRPI